MSKNSRTQFFFQFFIFLNTLCINAQGILFIDENQLVIENAKILISSNDKELLAIVYSDFKGLISYDFKVNTIYHVEINKSNFESKKEVLFFKNEEEIKTIVLKKEIENLKEITVIAQKAIVKKGDTTIIDIKKFALATDKNLKQVLSRIPGMVVKNDGSVTYKNKNITDMLINGRKLFDQDYQRALEFINSQKAVEVKVIENYNDYQGFEKKILNSNAIDIGFEGKNIFTGQLGAGYGTKDVKRADYSHLLVNSILSNYSKGSYQNLGTINFAPDSQNTPRGKALFYQIIQKPRHPTNLNDVYGNFVDNYELDSNFNIPFSENKDRPFILKYAMQYENSFLNNRTELTLYQQEQPINRLQEYFSTYDSRSHSITGSYKLEQEKFYLNSEMFFSNGTTNRISENKINEFATNDHQSHLTTQGILNTTLQFKNRKDRFHDLNIQLGFRSSNDEYITSGINEIQQDLKGNFYVINATYNYPLIKTNKFTLTALSSFDQIGVAYNGNVNGDITIQVGGVEYNHLWLNQLSGNYVFNKNIEADLTFNSLKLGLQNETVNSFTSSKILYPNIRISAKIAGINNEFEYMNLYDRITNYTTNQATIFTGNTFTESYNITNLFQESHNWQYQARWGDFINSWNGTISYKTGRNILLSDFFITQNSTNIRNFSLDRKEKQFMLQLSRDFLLFKKLSCKIGTDYFVFDSFQSSEGETKPFTNKTSTTTLQISKRLGRKWFFSTQTELNFINFNFNSFSNNVFNHTTMLQVEHAFNKSTAQINWNLNDYGSNNYVNFINAHYNYYFDKWSSSLSIKMINLMNIKSINSKNISALSSYRSILQIPQRRILVSWLWYF